MSDKQHYKKEKQFLEKPEYPGGKKALQAFITSNLRYPQDAFESGIQGIVSVSFDVNDNGIVESAKLIKGLLPSCDQEALRLVHLLQFGKAHNRGVRVKSSHKVNIHFKLPQKQTTSFQFAYEERDSTKQKSKETAEKEEYTYTVHIPKI